MQLQQERSEIFVRGSHSKMKTYPKLSGLNKYGSTKLALNGLCCVVGGSKDIQMNYLIHQKTR